jgi:glycerol-3-phosphate dehydrogenase
MAYLEAPAVPCRTHVAFLPGGEGKVSAATLAGDLGIDRITAARLAYRHGARANVIAERIKRRPLEATMVCACEPVTEAEVRHVIQNEMAATVGDVARRTRLGLGACGGMRCASRCGQIVAEERGLAPREGGRQALEFLKRQAGTRAVAMSPVQARQEALTLASIRAELGPLVEEDE